MSNDCSYKKLYISRVCTGDRRSTHFDLLIDRRIVQWNAHTARSCQRAHYTHVVAWKYEGSSTEHACCENIRNSFGNF